MKNFLKKLHIGSNQSEDSEGSTSSSKGNRLSDVSSIERLSHSRSHHTPEHKPFSTISGWLNSVTHRKSPSPPSSSNVTRGDRMEPSDSVSSSGLDAALDAARLDSGSSHSRDPDIEEEYQIQLALEISAREDPEAVQIEAVKQISLGSCPPDNTPAEVIAYRYWVIFLLSCHSSPYFSVNYFYFFTIMHDKFKYSSAIKGFSLICYSLCLLLGRIVFVSAAKTYDPTYASTSLYSHQELP